MEGIGVPRIVQWGGSRGGGQARESGGPPVESRGKAPVGDLVDKSPRSWSKMWNF